MMEERKKVTAIILAAGKGNRMQADMPKQYLVVCGKPVLYYSLYAFEQSSVDEIILVTRQEDITFCKKDIVEKYQMRKVRKVVPGGTERYCSVYNGLQACEDTEYVLIHDSARPCIQVGKIEKTIWEVIKNGACSLGVLVKDTIKLVDEDNYGIDTPPRQYLWQIQTPQAFLYKNLMEAYQKMAEDDATDITDDTMIIERYMHMKTKIVQGDYSNLKITTPEDMEIVENFFEKNKKSC